MQAIAVEDARVAKMMELETLFRSDPNLLRDYLTRERERWDYQASMRESEARGELRGERRGELRGERRGELRGERRGERRGTVKTLASLVQDGLLSVKDASARAQMTEEEFLSQMRAYA